MNQKAVRLEDILPLIWQLPEIEQEKLRQILEKEPIDSRNKVAEKGQSNLCAKRQLSELKGLGKELWQKVDVAKYLDEERSSWERPNCRLTL